MVVECRWLTTVNGRQAASYILVPLRSWLCEVIVIAAGKGPFDGMTAPRSAAHDGPTQPNRMQTLVLSVLLSSLGRILGRRQRPAICWFASVHTVNEFKAGLRPSECEAVPKGTSPTNRQAKTLANSHVLQAVVIIGKDGWGIQAAVIWWRGQNNKGDSPRAWENILR